MKSSEVNINGNVPSSHSLSADIATGWKPKLKIIGPMPLNFDNLQLDQKIREVYTSEASLFSVVYLGPRPLNSFAMHQYTNRKYKYKYEHLLCSNYSHMKPFYHKFYAEFQPQTKRPFVGMNNMLFDQNIIFDSQFESGNLDCAVKVRENEYDLVLRIDSNTAGHIQWYYFKIKNLLSKERKVKLNIVNLRRNKTSYQRGMRPYIRRMGKDWEQGGQNVMVTLQPIKFGKEINFNKYIETEDWKKSKKLSFELTMGDSQQIQVAYSIPYTYTRLIEFLHEKKKAHEKNNNLIFETQYCESLSGLQIPVLKITEHTLEKKKKYAIYIIGRQHPGESNSSFVMEGLINSILEDNQSAASLRRQCQFHIIPMVNPDGVVIGNFRTSLYGRDLNRLFKRQPSILIPEVECAQKIAKKIYKAYKKKFMMFLDIHGHSMRRNSFAYGPGIFDSKNIMDVRTFPKLISLHSQIFRYYSCTFRLEEGKKSTARATFGKLAEICYTIQTSNWCYNLRNTNQTFDFNIKSWKEVGMAIGTALSEHIRLKIEEKIKMIQKRRKRSKNGNDTVKPISGQKMFTRKHQIQNKSRLVTLHHENNKNEIFQSKILNETKTIFPAIQTTFLEKVQQHVDHTDKILDEEYLQNQSDKFSDIGNDSQGQEDDMNKNKFKKYTKNASMMIVEFKNVFYGEKQPTRERKKIKSIAPQKQKKAIQIMACLRKNYLLNENKGKVNLLQIRQMKEIDKKEIMQSIVQAERLQKNETTKRIPSFKKQIFVKEGILPKISSLLSYSKQETDHINLSWKSTRGQPPGLLRYQKKKINQ